MKGLLTPLLCLLMSGCLKLNLNSSIPQHTYYSLDSWSVPKSCHSMESSISLNVSVLSPYDTKSIMEVSRGGTIAALSAEKWIDLPKNMVRNAAIKVALNDCIHAFSNPSTKRGLDVLKIAIIDMYIYNDGNHRVARLHMSYELLDGRLELLDSGIVSIDHRSDNGVASIQHCVLVCLKDIISRVKHKLH